MQAKDCTLGLLHEGVRERRAASSSKVGRVEVLSWKPPDAGVSDGERGSLASNDT